MQRLSQSPSDPDFVQNPYAFYDRARAYGPLVHWAEYGMPAALSHDCVMRILRDRRLGRVPPGGLPPFPPKLADFARAERLSLLNLEGAPHAELRARVLRAFTARRVAGLTPEVEALCHDLIDRFPETPFDLMQEYAAQVPVIVIARLLGVPERACPRLLDWSHAMVAMYLPGVTQDEAERANTASKDFLDWLGQVMEDKRQAPGDDLLSALLQAEACGDLNREACLATCILLLNAGHEATVHALGNAVVRLLSMGNAPELTRPDRIAATVEECLRIDPPLHVFTRWVNAPLEIDGHDFRPGDQIACLLGAANRDPAVYDAPDQFRPGREGPTLSSFGAGVHFCLGAPLARLEMQIALRVLFERCPMLHLTEPARFADIYHFHGHATLRAAV